MKQDAAFMTSALELAARDGIVDMPELKVVRKATA